MASTLIKSASISSSVAGPKWSGSLFALGSGAIKINNFEGTNPKVVNGQRIKHYIPSNPINVETNVIETVTPEEYIRDTPDCFRLQKGIGMWYGK